MSGRWDRKALTVHSLAVKRASRLNQNLEQYPPAPQEAVNRMIGMALETAEAMGMEPYYMYRQKNMAGNLENVGYAKPGKECLYNILIMEEKAEHHRPRRRRLYKDSLSGRKAD